MADRRQRRAWANRPMRQAAARLPPPAPGAAGPRIRCRSMAARIALEADAQTETARPGRLPRLHQQRRRTGQRAAPEPPPVDFIRPKSHMDFPKSLT